MGNCATSPCGENNEPINIKDHNNKRLIRSLFQNENEKIASKTFLLKSKDAPIKLNHERIKLETIINDYNLTKTKSSNTILDTSDSYDKNTTEVSSHRKILSTQISNNYNDTNPYEKNDTLFKSYNAKNKQNERNKHSNDLLINRSIDINSKNTNHILIKDESSDNDNNDDRNLQNSERPASSILLKKDNLLKKTREIPKDENETKPNKITKHKDTSKEQKEEEDLEENKIVEEIRQNKMFYNSDGLKSFRRKTPKRTNYDQKDQEIKLSVENNKNQSKIQPISNAIPKQQNDNKNILKKNKSSNLTIITNPRIVDTLIINKNIEKFNREMNTELIKNKDIKIKEIMCDTIENVENILISCDNESFGGDEADKSVLNLDLIKSTTNKENESKALIKISKRPPTAPTNNIIPNSHKNKISNKPLNNNQATKISNKDFFNKPNLLNKTETEKKLEKKISLLLSANTNNYINNKINKLNSKSNNINDHQQTANKKDINTPLGNYLNSNLFKLNLNNPKIIKNSFDLSIPNNSTTNSTKSKTNSNKFSKSINSTPINSSKGKNVSEKKVSSIYSINPKIFQDKNILEFISDFQIN